MAAIPPLETVATPSLDLALRNAVVLGWNELMPTAADGVIRLEYHAGPERSLEYLKVWASSERGYWNLVGEYWVCSLWSHVPGFSFGKGYRAGHFSASLENVVRHETAFSKVAYQDGSIQIYPPTESERTAAKDWMTGNLAEFDSNSAMPAVAA